MQSETKYQWDLGKVEQLGDELYDEIELKIFDAVFNIFDKIEHRIFVFNPP